VAIVQRTVLKSDILLLITAVIWGLAFVAQRVGMDYIGPFTFNGIRFALGSLVLLPFVYYHHKKEVAAGQTGWRGIDKTFLFGGSAAGLLLFLGASFQQVGLVYTTAGNAGFITGLYVVIVPMLGILVGQRTNTGTWLGACLAALGLYFLSITEDLTIAWGDLLVCIGAFVWAAHVLVIAHFSRKTSPLILALTQFCMCSLLSLLAAVITESVTMAGLTGAIPALAYGGFLSVGIAYTLQVVAQRNAHPAHAAILLSLEAVFAAIGGGILLDERMTDRGLMGCGLMLAGMLLSQLWGWWRR
jgi:drug/metabolite transporter (DMT)-like permease